MRRVRSLPGDEILKVACVVQNDEDHVDLGEALAKIDEKSGPSITPLTRHRIVAELDKVPLAGALDDIDFLRKFWPIDTLPSPSPRLDEYQMVDYLRRRFFLNDDLYNSQV
jgi:hypothetical protein